MTKLTMKSKMMKQQKIMMTTMVVTLAAMFVMRV